MKTCLKRSIFWVAIVLILFSACAHKDTDNLGVTGFPSDGVHQPQIMYNDNIYYYTATGFDKALPDTFTFVGSVAEVDNSSVPSSNWNGSLVEIGQRIFADVDSNSIIYVEYTSGFAVFTLRNE